MLSFEDIIRAARERDTDALRACGMLNVQAQVDGKSYIPVTYLAERGERDAVLFTVEHGGSVNWAALAAAQHGHTKLTLVLLNSYGAQINYALKGAGSGGQIKTYRALKKRSDAQNHAALIGAAYSNQWQMVDYILEEESRKCVRRYVTGQWQPIDTCVVTPVNEALKGAGQGGHFSLILYLSNLPGADLSYAISGARHKGRSELVQQLEKIKSRRVGKSSPYSSYSKNLHYCEDDLCDLSGQRLGFCASDRVTVICQAIVKEGYRRIDLSNNFIHLWEEPDITRFFSALGKHTVDEMLLAGNAVGLFETEEIQALLTGLKQVQVRKVNLRGCLIEKWLPEQRVIFLEWVKMNEQIEAIIIDETLVSLQMTLNQILDKQKKDNDLEPSLDIHSASSCRFFGTSSSPEPKDLLLSQSQSLASSGSSLGSSSESNIASSESSPRHLQNL